MSLQRTVMERCMKTLNKVNLKQIIRLYYGNSTIWMIIYQFSCFLQSKDVQNRPPGVSQKQCWWWGRCWCWDWCESHILRTDVEQLSEITGGQINISNKHGHCFTLGLKFPRARGVTNRLHSRNTRSARHRLDINILKILDCFDLKYDISN